MDIEVDGAPPGTAATSNIIGSSKKGVTQQLTEIIIPSFSAWFQFGLINEIEEKALPEFFNNKNKSKTPQVYMDYRDFMVNTYRLNPHEYLTVTACRRNLAGDVCAIIRVHAVLEQWGLINYQIDPDSKPTAIAPPFTGHFRVSADTPRGIQPIYPAIPASIAAASFTTVGKQTETTLPQSSILTKSDIFKKTSAAASEKKRDADEAGLNADSAAKKVKVSCGSCGVECSNLRFHATKVIFDICSPCYREGRFPSTLFSGDFIKLTSSTEDASAWGDQETLLLLEGVEMFEDDWARIADHVGKSRDECILRFLKLPINDTFADIPQEKLGPLQYNRIPVSSADNPVLTMTAFLASLVPADVAKAAAQAAIAKLKTTSTPTNALEKSAATALASASAKAHHLASLEEIEMQKATRVTIELQLRKMELKLAYFQDMEAVLESERLELEKERHRFYIERLEFKNGVGRGVSNGNGVTSVPVAEDDDVDMKDAHIVPLN